MKIRVKHINMGWENPMFQNEVQKYINEMSKQGYDYYDIKISSSTENCLIIFKRSESSRFIKELCK